MNIQVQGQTLKSLRERYKTPIQGAARMTGIDQHTIEQWEADGVELSVTDAKKYAKAFHSHWSVLLLKSEVKPIIEPVNNRAGYSDDSEFSGDTMRAYEIARKILDASEEIDGQIVDERLRPIRNLGQNGEAASYLAKKVREVIGINPAASMSIKGGPAGVYNFWKEQVSNLGIYISEQTMPEDETKAFLLKEGDRAVIVVNKKDKYLYSRVFSLLHELGHLIKGEESAACLVTVSASRTTPEETWCNRFASELAAPDALVLADDDVNRVKTSPDPANTIRRLSSRYKVSFTVMLYKLRKANKVTPEQCSEMQNFFENVILPKINPPIDPEKEIRLGRAYYINKDLSKASEGLVKEVLEQNIAGKISYSETAKLLDTRTKYLSDFKEAVGFGS